MRRCTDLHSSFHDDDDDSKSDFAALIVELTDCQLDFALFGLSQIIEFNQALSCDIHLQYD